MEIESELQRGLNTQEAEVPSMFTGTHSISDRDFLLACELVTEIGDFWLFPRRGTLVLVKSSNAHPDTRLVEATPKSLQILQRNDWVLDKVSHWENIGSTNAYQGIVLINHRLRVVLLAHRGMQFIIPNLIAALQIGNKRVPRIVDDALNMCQIAVDTANRLGYPLWHTGFSMGGFLAQITATHCNHHHATHNKAVCYDPPGASDAISLLQLSDNKANIFIYVTAPNVVTTATRHYGYVRQIAKYRDKNPYCEGLASFAVSKALTIKLESAISDDTPAYVGALKTTLKYHDQKILQQDLGNASHFPFHHVHSWPLASNEFKYIQEEKKAEKKSISSFTSFGDLAKEMLCEMANFVISEKGHEILASADMSSVNAIQHQVLNPKVVYHHEAFLTQSTPQVSQELMQITLLVTMVAMVVFIMQNQIQSQAQLQDNLTQGSSNRESTWNNQTLQQRRSPITRDHLNQSSQQQENKEESKTHSGRTRSHSS